jgi:hypothetical protein
MTSDRCYSDLMVRISFPNRDVQREGLGFLMGRSVSKSGEHIVPDEALEALAARGFSFTVIGRASYEQQVAGHPVSID